MRPTRSYWERTSLNAPTDFLIVGSGFVGLCAALETRKTFPRASILVVDRAPVGFGASTRNAGFGCFGSPSELLDDAKRVPLSTVIDRVERRYRGLQQWLSWFSPDAFDWFPGGGQEVFSADKYSLFKECEAFLPELNRQVGSFMNHSSVYSKNETKHRSPSLPYALSIAIEGHLHPGKLMELLRKKAQTEHIVLRGGVTIEPFSHWTRTEKGWEIPSQEGILVSERVLVATNAFTQHLFPELEVEPARGQVLLTAPLPQGNPWIGSFHADEGYLYFRNVGQGLLLGGGRNRFREQEKNDSGCTSEEVMNYLESFLREHLLPHQPVEITDRWAGTMGFGPKNEKEPLVLQKAPGVVVACRMGGMGVALAPSVATEAVSLFR